jgi:hypothetical protein
METEADKLRRDVQRYCYLLGRITYEEVLKLLLELIGEAVVRLNEIEHSAITPAPPQSATGVSFPLARLPFDGTHRPSGTCYS